MSPSYFCVYKSFYVMFISIVELRREEFNVETEVFVKAVILVKIEVLELDVALVFVVFERTV